MNGKQIVQGAVVVLLLTSVLFTAALASSHGPPPWERLSPQDNNGRSSSETYGSPYNSVGGDQFLDGPGNVTTHSHHGVGLQVYLTLWSFDEDGEPADYFSQPYTPPNYTYDWMISYYGGNTDEANRSFRYFPIANETDFSFVDPTYEEVNRFNQNDHSAAPSGKFAPDKTTYVPEGIRQKDYSPGGPFGFVNALDASENHVADGRRHSINPSGANKGACRTFPDRDDSIDNGSHEKVTERFSNDPMTNDSHCWIESAYVDEHSVDGLVVMQEAFTGDPSTVDDGNPLNDASHPINDSRPSEEDNNDGVRRYIPDTGTARAIADFRANTTSTYSNADAYYPDSFSEAEFEIESKKIEKMWWNNPRNPHVNWTRLVNEQDCEVPSERTSTPDCELGLKQGDTHTPTISYVTDPSQFTALTGTYEVGGERKFIYQTKFSIYVDHYERKCMRITDPDDDDGDGDADGSISLDGDDKVWLDSGLTKVSNIAQGPYDGYDSDSDGVDNQFDECDTESAYSGSPSADGDCEPPSVDDDDNDGLQDGNEPNDSNACVPDNTDPNCSSSSSSSSSSSPTTTTTMLSTGLNTVKSVVTNVATSVVKMTLATDAYGLDTQYGNYMCSNHPDSPSNSPGTPGSSFADAPYRPDMGSTWLNAEYDANPNQEDAPHPGSDTTVQSNDENGDKIMAVVQTKEKESMDFIAQDFTYAHVQLLDETGSNSRFEEFDVAKYEDGDFAIHFKTDNEPWRRVELHGTKYGLSGGWSFYSARNRDYDVFTRYAYPSKESTYPRNIKSYYRTSLGTDAKTGDPATYDDDLRQNSSLTPLKMYGFPTEAGIRVSPDVSSDVVTEIEVTHDINDIFTEPPTVIGVNQDERRDLSVARELPKNAANYSRGTEIAFRYNRQAIKNEVTVSGASYGYPDQQYTAPSYDKHNITLVGISNDERRTINITKRMPDNADKRTINETNLKMKVVKENRSAKTVTVEFKLTSTQNGTINQTWYESQTCGYSLSPPSTGPIAPTSGTGSTLNDTEENAREPLGKIVVGEEYDALTDVYTRHDNGTVRFTYNKTNINGGTLNARYEPLNWWETPSCYPMHTSSEDEVIVRSAPLLTGWIAQLVALVIILSILSYAFNTVYVAAGGDRPDETFVRWLIDEITEALRNFLP